MLNTSTETRSVPKSKNWYDRLDKETKELVTGIAFIVFLLVLVFFLTNPIGAAVTFVLVGLVGFTIYSKYKTGQMVVDNIRKFT